MLNRLRANHYNLNESLAKKEYIDSPRCDCGAEIFIILLLFALSMMNLEISFIRS